MKARSIFLLLSLTALPLAAISLAEDTARTAHRGNEETAGEADALFQKARAYLYGNDGMPKDDAKSYELMRKAAAMGHADATGSIGYFLLTGTGAEKDPSEAVTWFRLGAQMGSAKAQLNLARCLLRTRKNPAMPKPEDPEEWKHQQAEGIGWLRKAAEQKLPEAATDLGTYLYAGQHGLSPDFVASEKWFQISAEAGEPAGMYYMGVLRDPTIPNMPHRDMEAAKEWYCKSAMLGNPKGQANFGRLMDPFSKDPSAQVEAIAWILLAREQHEPTSDKLYLHSIQPVVKPTVLEAAKMKARQLRVEIRRAIAGTRF